MPEYLAEERSFGKKAINTLAGDEIQLNLTTLSIFDIAWRTNFNEERPHIRTRFGLINLNMAIDLEFYPQRFLPPALKECIIFRFKPLKKPVANPALDI